MAASVFVALRGVRRLLHRRDERRQLGVDLLAGAGGRLRGRMGLEDPSELVHLQQPVEGEEVDGERQAADDLLGTQHRHVGARTVA
jgi:hypothetical protein